MLLIAHEYLNASLRITMQPHHLYYKLKYVKLACVRGMMHPFTDVGWMRAMYIMYM